MKYFYLEFIPVVPVFPEGPHGHLVGSGEGEDPRRKTLRHQAETEPGTNLKVKLEVITAVPVQYSGGQWQKAYLVRIVGTGDEAEETGERVPVRPGDLPDLTAGRSEVPEEEVDGEVPQLAGSEGRQAGVDLGGGGAGVERVVHVVTHVGSKPPVVSAVL